MPTRRSRYVIVGTAGLLGIATVIALALLLQWSHHGASCLRYFLVPRVQVCGGDVIYTNPGGARVVLGTTGDLAPMPRPPAKGASW